MTILRTVIASGVLIITIGGMAGPAAADASANPVWRAACRHDALTFCRLQALEYNVPGVRDCLVRNLDKVSDACRGVIKAAQAQHGQSPVAPAPH